MKKVFISFVVKLLNKIKSIRKENVIVKSEVIKTDDNENDKKIKIDDKFKKMLDDAKAFDIQFNKIINDCKKINDLYEKFNGQQEEIKQLKNNIISLQLKEKKTFEYIYEFNKIFNEIIEITDNIEKRLNDDSNSKLYNEKFKNLELHIVDNKKSTRNLDKKFNSLLDVIAEQQEQKTDSLPNLFVGDVSLKELWRKHKNNKDVLLYTIAYLMKKQFEEKGNRLK